MSISSINSNISRIQKDILDLQKKISAEKKKESDALYKANQVQRNIRSASASTLKSKLAQIERHNSDAVKANKNQADLQNKLASKFADLNRYQQQLIKEQDSERKKQEALQKKLERDQQAAQDQLRRELASYRENIAATTSLAPTTTGGGQEEEFDLFISHSSDDKEDFVRPLVEALQSEGVKVWYDELTLKVGDRLRRSIDNGLVRSRFGVIVVSSSFIKKYWTQYELDGLVAQEMSTGAKRILPVWHKVTRDEVLKYSPSLVDIVALDSGRLTIQEIAKELAALVK